MPKPRPKPMPKPTPRLKPGPKKKLRRKRFEKSGPRNVKSALTSKKLLPKKLFP